MKTEAGSPGRHFAVLVVWGGPQPCPTPWKRGNRRIRIFRIFAIRRICGIYAVRRIYRMITKISIREKGQHLGSVLA